MIYSKAVSTPANTTKLNAVRTRIKLTAGIIQQLDIVFPTGCAGLAYIAIWDGLFQVWPTNPEEFFHTDGETISFKEYYPLVAEPYELDIYTYNLDDTYAHELVIRLGILKQSEIQGVWLPWSEEVIA